MRTKKTKDKPADKPVKEGRGLSGMWRDMPEDKRIRILKIAGLVVTGFTIFTFISVFSYLFTWKADQSLVSAADMMDKGEPVRNMGGKLGYRWGSFLVGRCFGLGSFALMVLLGAVSVRLYYRNRSIGLIRTTLVTVSGAMLSSLILSYFASIFGDDVIFGGGLGGDCGAFLSASFINLIGHIPTLILLLIFTTVWLLYASGRFSRWFVAEKVKEAEPEAAERPSSGEDSLWPDSLADEDAGTDESQDEAFAYPVSGIADHDAEVPFSSRDTEVLTEEPEAGIEVVQGADFSAEVKKDLPRIDNREELENFKFPSLDLLNDYRDGRYDVASEELERNNNKIRATLLNYKIQVEKVSACVGPTVTLYKVVPAPGVKISAIRNLEEDIAIALGIKGVRVVTLSDAVGIEVANDRPSIVPLKAMLNDDTFRESKAELPIALGYTIMQKVKTFDLADAPHLLVAGATKQGKSVGLNVIITSLLYAKHPSELKFVFIDPKMVEFSAYSKLLKHYLAIMPTAASESDEMDNAIVKQPKQAEEILRSLCLEMDERYLLLSKSGVNNIKLYNDKFRNRFLLPTEGHRFLPYIVVVIDEYADLIMSGGMGVESKAQARSITSSIIRLAQKGRAAGIHVIIATQRPSVDVITGLIKTNFPTRIAFRVVTRVDSATILDKPGAEKLIGKGDMLYYAGVEMERVQCALVNMDEINKVTDFIGHQTGYRACYNTPYYLPELQSESSDGGGEMIDMQNLDAMFEEAAKMVVTFQQGSTSTLQRKLGMGYARAGRVMDQLEAAGIVGPQEGSKPRQVLVGDLAELEEILKSYMN